MTASRKSRIPIPKSQLFSIGLATLLICMALLATAPSVRAVSAAGSTGAAFLEIGAGPRAGAMGEANSAWANDVYGLYFNPAGAARAARNEVGFVYQNLIGDIDFNHIAYMQPLRSMGGTFGASFTYVDLGRANRTTIASSATNSYLGTFESHDLALSLSYARPFRSWLDLGGTLKFVNERLDNQAASAVAVDLGAVWYPPVQGLTFGLSLSNLGSSLQFIRESDELPLTFRAGAGWRAPSRRWGLVSDFVIVRRQEVEGKFGGEFWVLPERLALRGGFNTSNDADNGYTVGGAFHWNDLAVDYSFQPYGDLGDGHQVSLTYQFGELRKSQGGSVAAPPEAGRPARIEQTYGKPDPPLAATIISSDAPRVFVKPFLLQSGATSDAWIGTAIPEVFNHKWKGQRVLTPEKGMARYTIQGDYWIMDKMLIIKVTLNDEGWEAGAYQFRGDADKPFPVFDEMARRLTEELAKRGLKVEVRSFRGR